MASNGKITRKDLIEDKVLKIGTDYAKSLDKAIKANKKWLDSFAPIKAAALEQATISKNFKNVSGKKEFLELKKKEEQVTIAATNALKSEQQLLISVQ